MCFCIYLHLTKTPTTMDAYDSVLLSMATQLEGGIDQVTWFV